MCGIMPFLVPSSDLTSKDLESKALLKSDQVPRYRMTCLICYSEMVFEALIVIGYLLLL